MIRDFEMKDLEIFEPNAVSNPAGVIDALKDERAWNYTLERGGIKAIITFAETDEDEWAMSCLVSKHFNAVDSLELKRFMDRAIDALKPRKVWTISPPGAVDRWHRFLGLAFERKQEFEGKIYNMWSRSCTYPAS